MATRSLPVNSIALTVPAADWELAISTGAIEDPRTGQLYAPGSAELTAFQAWLPAVAASMSTEVVIAEPAGISLTMLMARCTAAINVAFPEPVWVRIEISQIRSSSGNLYVQAIERSKDDGRELAKATAQIWRANVNRIGRKFSEATGMELAAGIQVLVLVKPSITGQYGLGLQIIDIDPSYTLGDLQAKLKRIRAEIAAKGFGENNRRLRTPDDFFRVGVVSPEGAAGLEDFQAVADVLEQAGLCRFAYFHAIFQGDRAKESVKQAMIAANEAHQAEPFDTLVIIRGGGAASDLHWLDEYVLAAMVCRFHCPVFTGIGHERDKSLLDEYANRAFGTPSKVIGFIKESIKAAALQGQQDWLYLLQTITARLDNAAAKLDARRSEVVTRMERRLVKVEANSATSMSTVRTQAGAHLQKAQASVQILDQAIAADAVAAIDVAATTAEHRFSTIGERAEAQLARAGIRCTNAFASVTLAARRSIDGIDEHLQDMIDSVRAGVANQAAAEEAQVDRHAQDVRFYARRMLSNAEGGSKDLMEGILAHGVGPTLRRGFAIVRNAAGPVSTKADAMRSGELEIEFRDGTMKTKGIQDG
jgi:exodeoxyribonuclease VII large subunit